MEYTKVWPNPADAVANIIFDTDMGPDYDDTGAAVMLHNYANHGKANILAMVCSTSAPFGAPYLRLLNTYYGRPEIPIGTLKSKRNIMPTCRGFHFTINEFAKYETDIIDGLHAINAVEVYREVLSQQPDNSVTVVTTGMFGNLADLLQSQPDLFSDLSGYELVKNKVKLVVSMAGRWPDSGEDGEFNIVNDLDAAKYVMKHCPAPMMFSGFEIGVKVKTGNRLHETQADSPLRGGYHANMCSWDLTAMMYAVEGLGDYWDMARGDADIKGSANFFSPNETSGARAYLVEKMAPEQISDILEAYLLEPKKNNPDEVCVKGIDSADAIRDGDWESYAPHTYFYNRSTLKSEKAGSSLTVPFYGSGIDVYGGISPQSGKMAIYIDDSLAQIVDAYSENAIDTVALYSNHSLKKGNHKIKAEVLDEKNPLASGIGVTVDFFKIIHCDEAESGV